MLVLDDFDGLLPQADTATAVAASSASRAAERLRREVDVRLRASGISRFTVPNALRAESGVSGARRSGDE